MTILSCGLFVLSLMLLGANRFFHARLSGLRPVSLTEEQIREFFSLVDTNPNPLVADTNLGKGFMTKAHFRWDPDNALFSCLVLPPTNLFTASGLQAMRDAVAIGSGFSGFDGFNSERQAAQQPLVILALGGGWISWEDLDIPREDLAAALSRKRGFAIYPPVK